MLFLLLLAAVHLILIRIGYLVFCYSTAFYAWPCSLLCGMMNWYCSHLFKNEHGKKDKNTMQESPQYYSVEQAARILGVNEETVRRWCRDGKIPGVKRYGREYRIPRSYIDPEEYQPQQPEEKKSTS